ncbi:MAG: 2-hydroxyacyl-CoA dehydratase family protein [Proteobacteria bacterium]|nr:2-hydroxyacyl-CoA dehydratase family protein [Pseudomonadota bacterium]MBU1582800.1 2-hydroxyacyl-CoA dehydratase family protein [Pseudomonadota bacterium]MBU2453312.1 2-hydroxyacyl-CoA dehydratase family protein [Pseudomonadota bacterium]MBU2628050.1 2-hydroxyacyl-CoA dehydratase family protein [Pseudomonadota bacterium]
MTKKIGFTCAYTPVPLIEAAGFSPFRVFPESKAPDQAGHLLHDNLCPHVKKVLDRALADDLPDLEGMIFINSCDAMRRLSDAWHAARPQDEILLLDLPSGISSLSIDFLSKEYDRLAKTLFEWNHKPFSLEKIKEKIDNWNHLAAMAKKIEKTMSKEYFPGYASRLQHIINTAATDSIDTAAAAAKDHLHPIGPAQKGRIPVFIFGNLLFDPNVYNLFEEWNLHVAASDFCTSSRFISPIDVKKDETIFRSLAGSFLSQTPCARTMETTVPGSIAQKIVQQAKETNAKGVIGFTLKFCDPYLARIPMIRKALQEASLPFLMLEGDCTMGSLGQQQTRIEAFTEMLGV